MQPFKPYLHLERAALGLYRLHLAVHLPDGYALGQPSGPNQNGKLNKETGNREIVLPIRQTPDAQHLTPRSLTITVAEVEIDRQYERRFLVRTGLVSGSDSLITEYKGGVIVALDEIDEK